MFAQIATSGRDGLASRDTESLECALESLSLLETRSTSTASSEPQPSVKQSATLLQIPAELRLAIFQLVLGGHNIVVAERKKSGQTSKERDTFICSEIWPDNYLYSPICQTEFACDLGLPWHPAEEDHSRAASVKHLFALSSVCRQIHTEAQMMIFTENKVVFWNNWYIDAFLSKLSSINRTFVDAIHCVNLYYNVHQGRGSACILRLWIDLLKHCTTLRTIRISLQWDDCTSFDDPFCVHDCCPEAEFSDLNEALMLFKPLGLDDLELEVCGDNGDLTEEDNDKVDFARQMLAEIGFGRYTYVHWHRALSDEERAEFNLKGPTV